MCFYWSVYGGSKNVPILPVALYQVYFQLTHHTGMINEKTTAKNRSYLKFWFSLWQQLFVQIIRQRDEILSQHPNRNLFDELFWHRFSKLYMAATKTGQSIIFITHITIWHHYLCRKEFPTTAKKIKEKYWHMKRGPNFPDPPMNWCDSNCLGKTDGEFGIPSTVTYLPYIII